MEKVVCDASVVVKWYVDEEYSENALRLRDGYINGELQLIAPEILPFEVLNALRYSNLFNETELLDVAKSLTYYGIELYPLIKDLALETVKIALQNDITIYDASYIALAVLNNTVLYTADKKLIRSLKSKYRKSTIHISKVN